MQETTVPELFSVSGSETCKPGDHDHSLDGLPATVAHLALLARPV